MTYQISEQEWHAGELAMHRLMNAPTEPNPNTPFLTPSAALRINSSPVQAIGLLDEQDRPWTSIWIGERGFSSPVAIQKGDGEKVSGIVTQCMVDTEHDPVARILKKNNETGRQSRLSGLAIDLMERKRVKWAGTILGATFKEVPEEDEGSHTGIGMLQTVIAIDSSLGNCPKYLNKIPLQTRLPSPELHSTSTPSNPVALPSEAVSLISSASLFFLTTSHNGATLSTNHRGGPPGFLRLVLPDQLSEAVRESLPISTSNPLLAYPEYSGNRLYQSLGNLHETPYIGLAVPDFRSGDVFYATAYARILAGADAVRAMPRTNLAVMMELREWRLVKGGLSGAVATKDLDHWQDEVGWSPYNPPIRYLAAEQRGPGSLPTPPSEGDGKGIGTATLVERTELAPDIARFKFELASNSGQPMEIWTPGQYVVLSFYPELGEGYSHMNDRDPTSLNDDLTRTFTVSSIPAPSTFEITIRNVGRCTNFLFRANMRGGVELPVIGFGGEFYVSSVFSKARAQEEKAAPAETVGFVAGGIGITPLLAQMPGLRTAGRGVRLWWGLRASELEFAAKMIQIWPQADADKAASLSEKPRGPLDVRLFLSGSLNDASQKIKETISELEGNGVRVQRRRLKQADMSANDLRDVGEVYLCAGPAMTRDASTWLAKEGKNVVTESFDF